MIWWVLTYLDNYRPPHALAVLAETNLQAHLFMKWAKHKPSRRAIYKRLRGLNVWCGYEYIWDTPNLAEQLDPGNTFEHLFANLPLAPTDHVWYYLFSIGERPYKECQGPLIHVPPPELPMPSARIFNTTTQWIQPLTDTEITFNSVEWDDYGFYDPAQPTRLTVPVGALYAIGGSGYLHLAINCGVFLGIWVNNTIRIGLHGHELPAASWAAKHISLHTIWPLRPGDFLTLKVRHDDAVQRWMYGDQSHSPHFWIAQIGAFPISPP